MRPKRQRRGFYLDLAAYFRETGDTQTRIAAVVGTSQAHISRIAAGLTVPRPLLAQRLAAVCRVSVESFTRVYVARLVEQGTSRRRVQLRRDADHATRA